MTDIPLLEQTVPFAQRIEAQVLRLGLSRYRHRRLVNFVFKYDTQYLEAEVERFYAYPEDFPGDGTPRCRITEGLLDAKVGGKTLVRQALKVCAHMVFRLIGSLQAGHVGGYRIVRRCYVEDVEALFPNNDVPVRLVYPFPLNPRRQLAYIRFLRTNGYAYVLSGLPYRFSDLVRTFVTERTYASFLRLESRAQMAHAFALARRFPDLEQIECSDEYDIGSIYFCSALRRLGVNSLNVAHGIGKYLPCHAYTHMQVMTQSQIKYYQTFNRMDVSFGLISDNVQNRLDIGDDVAVVLLGQYSAGQSHHIRDAERQMVQILEGLAGDFSGARFFYKKHPNNAEEDAANTAIESLAGRLVQGRPERVVQISLYSTCQVDPNFIGDKYLVESRYVKPQFAFDDEEPVIAIEDLAARLGEWLRPRLDAI